MEQQDLFKQRLDIMSKEVEVLTKSTGLEFERISKAFAQLGNLLDVLYLETNVLIEMLGELKVIDQETFTKKLEETAKKVEEDIKKDSENRAKSEGKIISEKL